MPSRYPASSLFALMCVTGLFALSSCADGDIYKKLQQAGSAQESVNNLSMQLFERSPAEASGNLSILGSENIDNVQRDTVSLEGLLSLRGPIESDLLNVFESSITQVAPSFIEVAGKRISWKDPRFQIFMGYYHGTKAQNFIEDAMAGTGFSWKFAIRKTDGSIVTKTRIHAVELGSPFNTGYDTSEKTISFFKNPESENSYNPIDEATAVYHEFGHVAMAGKRNQLVSMPLGLNQDLDAIQEGLADYIAAAIADEDRILNYFSANFTDLVSPKTRTGINQFRSVQNSLFFPRDYKNQLNLDGRVVSGALNDYKRYLEGARVTKLSRCTGAACQLPVRTTAISSEDAHKRTVKLALLAFEDSVESTTFHGFAKKLEENCLPELVQCSTADAAVLREILRGRGLLRDQAITSVSNYVFGSTVNPSADFQVSLELGVVPFPNDEGFANANEFLEPCEVVLFFPNFKNNTTNTSLINGTKIPLNLYNWKIDLGGTSFRTLLNGENSVESLSLGNAESKLWGWMEPGDNSPSSQNLIGGVSSPWYNLSLGSAFTQRLSATFFPSPLGWLGRAPQTAGSVVNGQFRLEFETPETENIIAFTNDLNEQNPDDDFFKPNGINFPSLTVQETGTSFCPPN
jgi:hypothetical protein